jgi:hypothetical protein
MAVGAERAACGARHAERDAPRARQLRSRGVRVECDGRGPWHARSAHACEQSGAAQQPPPPPRSFSGGIGDAEAVSEVIEERFRESLREDIGESAGARNM